MPPNKSSNNQIREYSEENSIVFLKTNEPYGGLSNMAGGFPLCVNGVSIRTVEALYQACRFPHQPEVQTLIINQKSPMTAKMKSKLYRFDSRPDWNQVRVKIMRWCLQVKLTQNWLAFSKLLLQSGESPIVEKSWKDDFWGAKPRDDGTLLGMNVLGRLLMELRESVKSNGYKPFQSVKPLSINEFLLGGRPIETVTLNVAEDKPKQDLFRRTTNNAFTCPKVEKQPSLFDELNANETISQDYSKDGMVRINIANLRPHKEYKESGLPWVRLIPKHWDLVPNKAYLHVRKKLVGDRYPEFNLLSLTKGGVIVRDLSKMQGKFSADMGTSQEVRKGDLVFCLFDVPETPRTVGLSRFNGMITGAYTVMECVDSEIARFLEQYYISLDDRKLLSPLYSGLRNTIPKGRLLGSKVPIPPQPEREAIVRFLNYIDRRIQKYIRAKKKLIKLMEEELQAITYQKENPEIYDSWESLFPSNWKLLKARHLFCERNQRGFPCLDLLAVTQDKGVLLKKLCSKNYVTPSTGLEMQKRVLPGDFIISLRSFQGGIERSCYEGIVSPAYTVMKLYEGVDSPVSIAYYEILFKSRSFINLLNTVISGIRDGKNISFSDFASLRLPLPIESDIQGLDIQFRAYQDYKKHFDGICSLLQEFIQRLISDAVTGKVDVREIAAQLPDEEDDFDVPELDDALDEAIDDLENEVEENE